MRQTFRLLVTGSRTRDDTHVIEHALAVILARHPEGVLLVHGACPRGADAIAAAYAARTPGYHARIPHRGPPGGLAPARRTAGHVRNAEMVGLGADGCAAFLPGASPGTAATVRLARAAGIPIWLRTQPVAGSQSSNPSSNADARHQTGNYQPGCRSHGQPMYGTDSDSFGHDRARLFNPQVLVVLC